MHAQTYYIDARVAPTGQPANRAFGMAKRVSAASWGEALKTFSDFVAGRGFRVVSVRHEGK